MKKEEVVAKLNEFVVLTETFNHENYTKAVYVLRELKGTVKADVLKQLEEAWRNGYVDDNNKEVVELCSSLTSNL